MASGEVSRDELKKLNPFKVGAPTTSTPSWTAQQPQQSGGKFVPTFTQVRDADYRLNTFSGAYEQKDKSPKQKVVDENADRETLDYAPWWKHVPASVSQYENVGLLAASFLVPWASGTTLAMRAGRVAQITGEAAIREIGLHNVQETRTVGESAMVVGASAVIGGALEGAVPAVRALVGKAGGPTAPAPVVAPIVGKAGDNGSAARQLGSTVTGVHPENFTAKVGPTESNFRLNRILHNDDVDEEIGLAINTNAHRDLAQKNPMPATIQFEDALDEFAHNQSQNALRGGSHAAHIEGVSPSRVEVPTPNGLRTIDDSAGAMRANPAEHIGRDPDVPDAMPLREFDTGGARPMDSSSPKRTGVINAVHAKVDEIPIVGAWQSRGDRALASPFMSVRGLFSKLLPNTRRTALAESGAGQSADLWSRVQATGKAMFKKDDDIGEEGFKTYVAEMRAMTSQDHALLVREVAESTNMSMEAAYARVDQAMNRANESSLVTKAKNVLAPYRGSREDFSYFSALAARRGNRSVLNSISRRTSRGATEIMGDGVRRAARIPNSKYSESWLEASNLRPGAESYFPDVWDQRTLKMSRADFIEDVAPAVPHELLIPGQSSKQFADDLHRHLSTMKDELDLVDVSGGAGVDFTTGRTLNWIPQNIATKYMLNDYDQVMNQYIRRLQRDISAGEHFGTAEWRGAINDNIKLVDQELQDQLKVLRETITDPSKLQKAEAKLVKRYEQDIKLLEDSVDEAIGAGAKTSEGVAALKAGASSIQLTRQLFSSISDLSSTRLVDIVTEFVPGFFKELGGAVRRGLGGAMDDNAFRAQAKEFATISDHTFQDRFYTSGHVSAQEMRSLDTNNLYRFLHWAGETSFKFGGNKVWTDAGKIMHTKKFVNDAMQILRGERAATADEIGEFGRFGLPTDTENPLFQRLHQQALQHGEQVDGIHLAGVEKWDDQEAADLFRAITNKYVDTKFITPDPSTAMVGEREGAMSLFWQYTSFTRAFIDKAIIPTMEKGRGGGATTAMILKLGAMAYMGEYARVLAKGEDPDKLGDGALAMKAFQQVSIAPFGFMPGAWKVMDTFTVSLPEMLGVQSLRFGTREAAPAYAAAGALGKTVVDLARMDDSTSEQKAQKTFYNATGFVPMLNAWWLESVRKDFSSWAANN